MWKRLSIYSLLFLSLVLPMSLMTSQKASAIASYVVKPLYEREIKREILLSYQSDGSVYADKGLNMHYYFYRERSDQKDSDNRPYVKGIAYVCEVQKTDYSTGNPEIKTKTLPDCGIFLREENGFLRFYIKASSIVVFDYYTDKDEVKNISNFSRKYDSSDTLYDSKLLEITDQNIDDGFRLLGGTELKENGWRVEEEYVIKVEEPKNNNSSNSGIFAGIQDFLTSLFNGIKDFLTAFFKPMQKSLDSTVDFFQHFNENFEKIIKFFENIGKTVFDWLVSLIIPDISDIKTRFDDFAQYIKNGLGFIGEVFSRAIETHRSIAGTAGSASIKCSTIFSYDTPSANFSKLYFNICHIPQPMLMMARSLIAFSMFFITMNRLLRALSVILGTRYVWQSNNEGDED